MGERVARNSAKATVSPGKNVGRNVMFQVPLWEAEATRSIWFEQVANMRGNWARSGALRGHLKPWVQPEKSPFSIANGDVGPKLNSCLID